MNAEAEPAKATSNRRDMSMKFVKSLVPLFGLLLASNGPARAQSTVAWDSSGNNLLQGVYNYRQVLWLIGDNSGNLGRAVSFSGTITFDGSGAYTLSASVMDSNANQVQSLNKTGTHSVAASGQGFLSSPLNQTPTVFRIVSHRTFVDSSSEAPIHDLLSAASSG